MFLSAFRLLMADLSLFVKLLLGGLACCKILELLRRISSAASTVRPRKLDSTLEMMSSTGRFFGVSAPYPIGLPQSARYQVVVLNYALGRNGRTS
ncbi:hypothetical protein Trydic_g18111 [Trypoxylus dichotomus]